MPTTRPRHSITETAAVEAALAPLRSELAGERVDLSELVVLGAEEKLRRLRDERASGEADVAWLFGRMRAGDWPYDPALADAVKRPESH